MVLLPTLLSLTALALCYAYTRHTRRVNATRQSFLSKSGGNQPTNLIRMKSSWLEEMRCSSSEWPVRAMSGGWAPFKASRPGRLKEVEVVALNSASL